MAAWVPIAERLPEPWQAVLVAADRGVVRAHHYDRGDGQRRFWYTDDDEDVEGVTHWMDLPALPGADPIAAEIELLAKLGEAHGLFLAMPRQHPDELRDFADALHRLQDLVALRVAQAYRPDVFPVKSPEPPPPPPSELRYVFG